MMGPITRPGFKPGFPPRIKTDAEMGRPDRRLAIAGQPGKCECCGRDVEVLEHSSYEPMSTSVPDKSSPLWCESCLEGAAEDQDERLRR